MARKAKVVEEIDEEVELEELTDEVEEEAIEEAEGDDMLSAKQAAAKIGTDGRTLRKFLRSQRGLVGQGNRWAISEDELPELKEKFANWHKPKAPTEVKVKKAAKVTKVQVIEVDEVEDDFEDLDELTED